MFIPISTDAPLYHRPVITLSLIGANLAAFLQTRCGNVTTGWLLRYGDGLHPSEWLLSAFLHFGPQHLLGNLLFLWIFGQIVEGKLGWRRFLFLYVALAMIEGALTQLLMLGYSGPSTGCGGASGVIFGLLAISLLWAPENTIEFVYVLHWGFGIVRSDFVEYRVVSVAAFYLIGNLVLAALHGLTMGTGALHLLGALLGAGAGGLFLKQGWVDCENWDLLSIWRGDHQHHSGAALPASAWKTSSAERIEHHTDRTPHQNQRQLQADLEAGRFLSASTLYLRKSPRGRMRPLSRADLQTLIDGLVSLREWTPAATHLRELLQRFPEQSVAARLALAGIYARDLHRPRAALECLNSLGEGDLSPSQWQLSRSIRRLAQQRIDQGLLELSTLDGSDTTDRRD